MRLPYAPLPFDDELAFSILARARAVLLPPSCASFSTMVFGAAAAVATIDLPGRLDRMGVALGMSGRALARGHTLLPYYASCHPAAVAQAVENDLLGDGPVSAHVRLGVAAFRIRPPETLRFCASCRAGQLADAGEAGWLRAHQLPGSLVCAVHGEPLVSSGVGAIRDGRHAFVALDAEVGGEAALQGPPHRAMEILIALARSQAGLLHHGLDGPGLEHRAERYRDRLAAAGLMRSRHKADLVRIEMALRDTFGPILRFLPDACSDLGSWPAQMVRSPRKAMHPLLHAMMGLMLDGASRVADPFGWGPWPCLNPLGDHHGELRIMTMERYRNRGDVVGVFTCACGYSYTRGLRADGIIGSARLRDPGPALGPALRRLLVPGAKLRQVARAVGMDPKTLMRHAAGMGLETPWTTRASGRPAIAIAEPVAVPVAARERPGRPARARVDWAGLDARTALQLRSVAAEILEDMPPRRVTLSELERRLGRPGWLGKRMAKLPATAAALAEVVEDLDTFRRRRIRAVHAHLGANAEPWMVMRKAGVTRRQRPAVREEMLAAGWSPA